MPWTANRAVSFHQELLVMGVGVSGSLRFMIAASKVTLQKGMATHSSILACRIPWTEGPGGCLENPMDRRAWQAIIHRATKSWTRLKRLRTYARSSGDW